jgi:hypothetical protein
MSNEIKVGDLVQVVKESPCAVGGMKSIGMIFRVADMGPCTDEVGCRWCGGVHYPAETLMATKKLGWRVAAYRLKRIPPLDELDDVKRDEEITA